MMLKLVVCRGGRGRGDRGRGRGDRGRGRGRGKEEKVMQFLFLPPLLLVMITLYSLELK